MGKGKIQEISERLSDTFQRLVPLQPIKGHQRPSVKELAAASEIALKQFYQAAYRERQQHHLGIVGRARVAIQLQKYLLEAGYPPALVKQVLFAMLTAAFVGDENSR